MLNEYSATTYGSFNGEALKSRYKNIWKGSEMNANRACRNQIVFILLLIFTFIIIIVFNVYPIKQRLPSNRVQDIDITTCESHICLYEISEIDLTNSQIELLQNHPSTIPSSSQFAYINHEKFEISPSELTISHPEGFIISMPLISFRVNGLYYFEDNLQNKFLLTIDSSTNKIEGYGACNGQKFELHSIGDQQFYLLIQKNTIQDTTNWCGIFAIDTKIDDIDINDDDDIDINMDNIDNTEDMAIWLNKENMITNNIGLDGLLINKDITNQGFIVEPLCSDLSPFDGNVYCLYPDDNSWHQFVNLRFYQYSLSNSLWTEMVDVPLNIANSTINLPQTLCIYDANEVYVFSVNSVDKMVNIYSFTTSWRLHHYTPIIGGDIDKVEIDSVYINDVLYFSLNEYNPLGNFTVYHYTDDIFSVFDTHQKIDVPIYSHCLTQYNDQLITFYVDYGHNLWAYYNDLAYNMEFNIANDIETNQFQCIWTENGHIISWKKQHPELNEASIYYLQLSPDNFQQIVVYTSLPWKIAEIEGSETDLFQLISMRNSLNGYKSVSVYYTNDIINNYLSDIDSITMDVSSIITLSNIMYGMHNKYQDMIQLINLESYDQDIDGFTSYEGQSDINILLVDTISDDDEIGYSQCDDNDQSFAVVQYTVF